MRRVVVMVLVGCGPSVGVGDGDGDAGLDESSGAETTGFETMTSATSSMTAGTTMTSATTVDSVDDDVDDGDDDVVTDGDTFIIKGDIICFTHCSPDCDQFAQDCPDGEKCAPWANDGGDVWNSNKCVPIERAAAAVGEACTFVNSHATGFDDCDIGAMCFGVDPVTNEGTCVPTCAGSEDAPVCPDGLECTRAYDGYLNICLQPCDPLAPSCGANEVCAHAPDDPVGAHPFFCYPTTQFDAQPYGAPCGGLALCGDGLACVPAELVPGCIDAQCCSLLGDLAAPPECPDPMQACLPISDGDPPQGLCVCGVPG